LELHKEEAYRKKKYSTMGRSGLLGRGGNFPSSNASNMAIAERRDELVVF